MKIFNLFFNVKSSIKREDFSISRYYFIWEHYSKKRPFNEYLEKHTINEANNLIKDIFPDRMPKKIKIQLIDCILMFLRSYIINYDYFSKKDFSQEFNKIIKYNYEKISKQNN
jgi:hypothetical protein